MGFGVWGLGLGAWGLGLGAWGWGLGAGGLGLGAWGLGLGAWGLGLGLGRGFVRVWGWPSGKKAAANLKHQQPTMFAEVPPKKSPKPRTPPPPHP